jgi:DMSO/TMAO reductase YedYZ molybdopterin-dependent catalytic subunit
MFTRLTKSPIKLLFICIIALVIVAFVGSRYINLQTDTIDVIEIQEYQGTNLSSINDFRENSILGPQFLNNETYRLKIRGLVNNETDYGYSELLLEFQSHEKVVTLYCVEGWDATILWEGFFVQDLFEEIGVKPEAKVAIFYAADGYSTSLPVEYLVNNQIMIAHKMNGVILPPERGFPFQLVAESKWGYKWIKWITEIELSTNEDYEGYWESRGYSNDADLPDFI